MSGWSRRGFLGLAMGVAAGVANGFAWITSEGRAPRGFAALFPDPDAARVLGEEYLRANPGVSAAELDAQLASRGLGRRFDRTRVATAVRRDFAAGDTVQVAGWILSRTEVALYAKVALG